MKNRLLGLSKTSRFALLNAALLSMLALGFIQSAHAQSADEMAEMQMQYLREQMKAAGMDPDEVGGPGEFVTGIMQQGMDREANEREQAMLEFKARNAGFGKAVVTIEGEEYELQITQCDTNKTGNYVFEIQAQQGPDKRVGMLSVVHDRHYKRVEVSFNFKGAGDFETYIHSKLPKLENQKLEWKGEVDGSRGRTELAMSLNCGAAS
ncbi:MAG: hypothetical protein WBM61_06720 [Woeseiaceae bacterium]|jgi:hypothetical protein